MFESGWEPLEMAAQHSAIHFWISSELLVNFCIFWGVLVQKIYSSGWRSEEVVAVHNLRVKCEMCFHVNTVFFLCNASAKMQFR